MESFRKSLTAQRIFWTLTAVLATGQGSGPSHSQIWCQSPGGAQRPATLTVVTHPHRSSTVSLLPTPSHTLLPLKWAAPNAILEALTLCPPPANGWKEREDVVHLSAPEMSQIGAKSSPLERVSGRVQKCHPSLRCHAPQRRYVLSLLPALYQPRFHSPQLTLRSVLPQSQTFPRSPMPTPRRGPWQTCGYSPGTLLR